MKYTCILVYTMMFVNIFFYQIENFFIINFKHSFSSNLSVTQVDINLEFTVLFEYAHSR